MSEQDKKKEYRNIQRQRIWVQFMCASISSDGEDASKTNYHSSYADRCMDEFDKRFGDQNQ